jgi:hypothetical protein
MNPIAEVAMAKHPGSKSRRVSPFPPQPPAEQFPGGQAGPAAAPPSAAATPEELDLRLMALHEIMAHGVWGSELVALAQAQWGISRRTAQWYVQKAKKRMARHGDRLASIHPLSQVQRSRLLERILRTLREVQGTDHATLRTLASLVSVAERLIEGRERSAQKAEQRQTLTVKQQFTGTVVAVERCASGGTIAAQARDQPALPNLLPDQEIRPERQAPVIASAALSPRGEPVPLRETQ